MAEFIVMPKLGFDMREGVLVSWLKDLGDSIAKGEVVAEIESDKATLELEAQSGGTLLHFLADEGAVVPIGGNLAIVGEKDEDIAGLLESMPGDDGKKSQQASIEESAASEQARVVPSIVAEAVPGTFPGGVRATPVARRIAEQQGVDLSKINGSGPGGRIRKVDVEGHIAGTAGATARSASADYEPVGAGDVQIPTSRLRQAIGRRMVESKSTVPHFYVTSEIDMGPALSLRKEINALLPEDQKVTVNDMIVKATAIVLRDYPNLNASFAGDSVIQHQQINVGSAVAVEGGLLTVVQKNTDTSTLAQIAIDNKSMVARVREGKSHPDDFDGVTFTVSNLGAFDVDHFIAIINPPNAAILAVGSAQQMPVVVDGELGIGWRMKTTISADHRVTDGAEAARFMQQFKATVEEPLKLLL
ncbi:MAG: dihydrolipoamide acetyltransferase family protein [Candidatus Promineifilaceae bacterium]